jgi:hypothetical protein
MAPRFATAVEGNDMGDYKGTCFCGAVEVTATGEPAAMGYCHCASCRHWSAGPVNAFTLWPPANVKITKGADNVGKFAKTPKSIRQWCKTCGGHLAMGLTDVYAAILPGLKFSPGLHVFYEETVLRIPDGKPKQKDVPAELGGSGALLAE